MLDFPNAKINIGLSVTGKRKDGFHNIETVFYPVPVHDIVEVVESDDTVLFGYSGIRIPGDMENNLCLRAYQVLKKDFDLPPVKIHLHKNIPIGAGLGGGSSDASFVLKILNNKFKLDLEDENLEDYARQLGSDCAFFIQNKPVFAAEKGDQFEPIKLDLKGYFIVLVYPEIHISTAEAYSGIRKFSDRGILKQMISTPVDRWEGQVHNDFEEHLFQQHPNLLAIKKQMYIEGAVYASMTGSGSSIYGLFETEPRREPYKAHKHWIKQLN